MASLSPYHKYLLLGKISKTLSPTEEQELETLFAKNSDTVEEYLRLVDRFSPDTLSEHLRNLEDPGFWRDIPGEIRREANIERRRYLKIGAAVASIMIIVVVGWFTLNNGKDSEKPVVARAVDNKVQLTLADGKIIDLSSDTGTIIHADLTITNSDNSLSYTSNATKQPGINAIEVPNGMDYQINLSDGSKIWLNSATRLEFPSSFSAANREITIDGEAYLEIAKNSAKPFIVRLPGATVQVLGTAFNVNSYDSGAIKVALVDGGVKMATAGSALQLEPGMQGVLSDGTMIQEKFDAKKVLSWRSGLYYFNRVPLAEITKVIERWFGISTIVDNPELSQKKYVGVLDKNKPIEYFLDNLRNISRIETYFDKDGVLHFK